MNNEKPHVSLPFTLINNLFQKDIHRLYLSGNFSFKTDTYILIVFQELH